MSSKVSVITPTFNSEKFIKDTIQSVQGQTYENWEMIIVDDGSSDGTVEIIENIQKNECRIKLVKSTTNQGPGWARNKALELVDGKYIAFLDADDMWLPNKLDKQIRFMSENGLPFTYSFYEWMDEDGNLLNKVIKSPQPLTYVDLLYCNYIGNLTGIYDRDFFGKIPISHIRKRQDWMQWLVILDKLKIAHPVPEVLALYRIRKNSVSSSKVKLIKHNFNVYKKFLGKSNFSSCLHVIRFMYVHFFIKPKYTA